MSEKDIFWRFSLRIDEKDRTELNWSYLSSRGPSKKQIKESLLKEFHIELICKEDEMERVLESLEVPKITSSEHLYYEDVIVSSAIPFDYKTTDIVVYRNKIEVFRMKVPQEKPSIKLLQKVYRIQEKLDLNWDYKTSSPENTWFRVFIELDKEKRYPISDIIRDNNVKIDYSELPGCEKGKVLVMISDGVWTAEDFSEEFKLPFIKPSVKILSPKKGQKIQSYDLLQLSGRAWDHQNLTPISSENLVWKLDGKIVGKGKIFVIDTIIALGKHIISLDAEDNNGISNSDEIEIEIFQAKHPKIIKKDKYQRISVDIKEHYDWLDKSISDLLEKLIRKIGITPSKSSKSGFHLVKDDKRIRITTTTQSKVEFNFPKAKKSQIQDYLNDLGLNNLVIKDKAAIESYNLEKPTPSIDCRNKEEFEAIELLCVKWLDL